MLEPSSLRAKTELARWVLLQLRSGGPGRRGAKHLIIALWGCGQRALFACHFLTKLDRAQQLSVASADRVPLSQHLPVLHSASNFFFLWESKLELRSPDPKNDFDSRRAVQRNRTTTVFVWKDGIPPPARPLAVRPENPCSPGPLHVVLVSDTEPEPAVKTLLPACDNVNVTCATVSSEC